MIGHYRTPSEWALPLRRTSAKEAANRILAEHGYLKRGVEREVVVESMARALDGFAMSRIAWAQECLDGREELVPFPVGVGRGVLNWLRLVVECNLFGKT